MSTVLVRPIDADAPFLGLRVAGTFEPLNNIVTVDRRIRTRAPNLPRSGSMFARRG
jgi:hypothetical protein